MKKVIAILLTACMLMATATIAFAGDDFDFDNYYRAREPKNGENYEIGRAHV